MTDLAELDVLDDPDRPEVADTLASPDVSASHDLRRSSDVPDTSVTDGESDAADEGHSTAPIGHHRHPSMVRIVEPIPPLGHPDGLRGTGATTPTGSSEHPGTVRVVEPIPPLRHADDLRGPSDTPPTVPSEQPNIVRVATPIPPSGHAIDLDAARSAVSDLLVALGQNLDDAELLETPKRVADAYAELLTPEPFTCTTFPNDGHYDEMVIARSIPMHSLCAHHLLPFIGVAHVAYLPGERIVGLSKLARIVDHFSRRLQNQERLTTQVADWLCDNLAPKGVGVLIEAEHLCMSLRGVQATGSRTVTSAVRGKLRDDPRTRAEFLSLARGTTP